jgi:acetylornithine deacetylase
MELIGRKIKLKPMSYTNYFLIFFILILATQAQETTNYKELISNHVKELKKGNILKILQNWIQQRSFSGSEEKIQNILKQELLDLGLEIDMYEMKMKEMKKSEFFVTQRKSFKKSPNIVAILKGKGENKISVNEIGQQKIQENEKFSSIILNGHVDVVPEGEAKWTEDAFSAKIENGKLYGRGTTDMKGGIFSSYLALKILKDLNIQLKGDVIFQSVVEEESGGAGTLSTVLRGYKADAAIIPEPTNMKIFPKQQVSSVSLTCPIGFNLV